MRSCRGGGGGDPDVFRAPASARGGGSRGGKGAAVRQRIRRSALFCRPHQRAAAADGRDRRAGNRRYGAGRRGDRRGSHFYPIPPGSDRPNPHISSGPFAAANGAGKTLRYVPPGTYSVSQLHLRNGRDFQLHLAAGCLLKVKPGVRGGNEHRHGLWLQDCENVSVTGRGCIDHQAYEHYALGGNDYQHGMVNYYSANELCPWITQSPLFITGSRRVRIEGITIRNGTGISASRNCRGRDDVHDPPRQSILTPPACNSPEYADGHQRRGAAATCWSKTAWSRATYRQFRIGALFCDP